MGPNKGRGARGEKLPEGGRWGPRGIRLFMGRGGGITKILWRNKEYEGYFTLQFSTDCALAKYVFKKYTEGENLLILSL